MKGWGLFSVMVSGLLLSSCAGNFWASSPPAQPQEPVVSRATEAQTILSCLVEHQPLSRKDYKAAYKTASAQASEGAEAATLRLICLSLHEYASYKQFKSGMATLANYSKGHPDAAAAGLEGIQVLMRRLEKEMTVRWAQSNKKLGEKEGLGGENKELLERNEALEKGAAQDQERISELQAQIEQLKNIDNIIKHRER